MGDWMRLMGCAAVLAALGGVPAHATFSRVESMGKKAEFFMDDVSIFDNPANMNIFPNFLIGELGTYRAQPGNDTGSAVLRPVNRDPDNSWFGGIFSYSPSRRKGKGNLYPQYSIGGAFNRLDDEILPVLPDSADGWVIPKPATNFDGFLGMTLGSGGMLGSHVYAAVQQGANLVDGRIDSANANIRLSLFRGDVGVNWPLGKNVDAELSLGAAQTAYGPDSVDAEWSFFVKARAFSTLEIINGEIVPILNYSRIGVPGKEIQLFHFGLGANVSLDRGFFWIGLQGLWDEWKTDGITRNQNDGTYAFNSNSTASDDRTRRGISVGFGIERNIWWDWLVLRVGGRKEIVFDEERGTLGNYSYIYTNPTGDMTSGDQVGFGIGVNVEEKLKVDATLAEDLPYTFGNLLSGPHHHVISRISATYSF